VVHNISVLSGSATGYLSLQVFGNNQLQNSSVKHFDFDGDGRQDLLIYYSGSAFINLKLGFYPFLIPLLSRGTSAPVLGTGILSLGGSPSFGIANWNDDACTDLYLGTTLEVSPCNGSLGTTLSLPAIPTLALDWDGDGRTDLLANVSGTWQLYRSEGNAIAPAVSTGIPVGSGEYIITDQNGDGLDDLVFANSAASNAIYFGVHNGANIKPDLATSFVDGYGNSVEPAYGDLTQGGSLYLNFADAAYPYRNYIGPMYVVSKTTFSDPSNAPSGTFTQTMSYYGAWLNIQGRGFAGFNDVGNLDSRNGVLDTKWHRRDFPFTGILSADWISQPNTGATFSVKRNNTFPTLAAVTLDATLNNQRYFPYVLNSTSSDYELGGALNGDLITTSATTWTYDSNGNATNISTSVTDNDPTPGNPYLNDVWTTTTAITYAPANTGTWCLNLPTERDVTNTPPVSLGSPAITRHVGFSSNATDAAVCRVTQQVVETGTPYQLTSAFSYDSFGNLNGQTDTGVGVPVGTPATRTTAVNWGTTGQLPTTETNALSQTTQTNFDPNTGQLLSVKDANNILTGWQYDDFQRPMLATRPDGTKTTWTYSPCASACINSNNKMIIVQTNLNRDGSTLNIQNAYLDSLDRVLATSTQMVNGAYDLNEVQYDNLGNVHKRGAPSTFVLGTAYWATYAYDGLNRLTSIQTPTSATVSTPVTTSYTYQGRTTTITDPPTGGAPAGRVTTKITLPSGLLARTQDNTGYKINFSYDAFGSLLTAVDSASPSNTLFAASYAYGIGPFQVASTDADLGAWTWTYDSFGELASYIDAKGQNFSFVYDALSRQKQRTEPDQAGTNFVTNWNWGSSAASFNIGKLQSVSAASSPGTYSESYVYDSTGRLSTDTIVVPGDTSYTYTISYNANTGLLDTLQYPVSTASYQLKLQYSYASGILKQIADISVGGPGTQYWTANTMNPSGQLLQESLGNGVVVNHAFDAVTGLVQSIQAGVGGGAALQNNSYLFDAVGNLTQRQDGNAGVTENAFPDSLYRLDHTVGDTNTQLTYDSIGRMSSYSTNGGPAVPKDYTTPQPGCTYYADHTQPHAVRKTTFGSSAQGFCYDANGNVSLVTFPGVASVNIAWTGFNKPNSISNGANISQFYYGPDHQRFEQLASVGGVVENTIYVGGLLEKMGNASGTAYRHYILAGSNTIVYSRSSSGVNSTYYLTQDHLGSSAVITDQTGTSLVKEKFSAMGGSENSTPEQNIIAGVTRHGFTGHEGLSTFNYVNMDGRIYVTNGGMFLSADPYVPDPTDTQSFNRYSYGRNNPLSRVDPTGYDDLVPETTVTSNFFDAFASDINSLGDAIGGALTKAWDWLTGGGDNHLSAAQQNLANHGVLNAQNLQGVPGAVSSSDDFKMTFDDAPSGTQGPQVTPITEITVTSERLTLEQFAAGLDLEQAENANFSNQSVVLQQELLNYQPTSVSTVVINYGKQLGPVALDVASFIPPIAVEARVIRAGVAARTVSRLRGPIFDDLARHAASHSLAHPSAYYNAAVRHLETGARFTFRHDGQFKNAFITRTGPDSFTFTSASKSGNRIFTHIDDVSTQYLRNIGITLPNGF